MLGLVFLCISFSAAARAEALASDVTIDVLKCTGHWILEERPKETTDALVKFL